VCVDCAQSQKRRGSKVQDDEDEEVVKYFKVKPENQVVKLGQYFPLQYYIILVGLLTVIPIMITCAFLIIFKHVVVSQLISLSFKA